MSRPVSPATSIGTHISGISHPPSSRKRRRISVLNGISGDELLNRISDWDDGQKSASSISHTSRSPLSLSAISTETPKGEDNKATRASAPPVLDKPLPRGHLDHPVNWYEDIEKAQVPTELDKLRNEYQEILETCHSRITRLMRHTNVLQGNTRQQAEETQLQKLVQQQAEQILSLTAERDYYRDERDFYHDHFTRFGPPIYSAPPPLRRPPSPYCPETSPLRVSLKDAKHRDKDSGDSAEPISKSLHPSQKRKHDTVDGGNDVV